MSWEAWLTLAVVLATVAALARERLGPAPAVLGAAATLLGAGVITPQQALAGFSNPAPVTVAALYVVARAVEKTGALQPLIASALGDGPDRRRGLAKLLLPTAGASAFLNNTPIVALLAPQVAEWAARRGRPASFYLMPLSFAAILGGTVTVIGTSTNLVVSGLLEAAGHAPIGMFEITRVGLPVALLGVVALLVLAPVLLPARHSARRDFQADIREFVLAMEVEAGGALDGATVQNAGLRHLGGVFLAEIERDGQVIAPVAPTAVLRGGDLLGFAGLVDQVVDVHAIRGLRSPEHRHALRLRRTEHAFFEAVVSGASPLLGRTLKEVGFRGRYQAVVLAIHRAGARVPAKLGAAALRAGDTLLLLTDPEFGARWRDRSEFLLVAPLERGFPSASGKAALVAAITLGIVVLAGAGVLPILTAALLGAVALVLFGVLSAAEARAAVDLEVIAVIAGAFALASALEVSGLAALVGTAIIDALRPLGTAGVLLAVTLAAALLTELITNNAAAALIFPIAVAAAAGAGLDPRPVAIAVAVAASASFLTPIGYQTNTMVYGLGGYRFRDYARLGVPLTVVVIATLVGATLLNGTAAPP